MFVFNENSAVLVRELQVSTQALASDIQALLASLQYADEQQLTQNIFQDMVMIHNEMEQIWARLMAPPPAEPTLLRA